MQEIRSCRDIVEPDGSCMAAVRELVRRLVLQQADVTTSHSTRLSKDESQFAGYQYERAFNKYLAGLSNLLGRMNQLFFPFRAAALEGRHEVAIMYFGRTSDFLMMTSERMAIPGGICTLDQVMDRLRVRGGRWVDELDASHAMYAVNGLDAGPRDTIRAGDEIRISSKKSIFEA
ncbi:MAG: hypothetical protein HYZ46_08465 [Nitrosomonadales bacterium]|nr:hypothetical protein [Nitrosomonadales bacterium]